MTDRPVPTLSPALRAFVTRWGEIGRNWGLPRGAAQIHGLLLASDDPLTADEIADVLSIARSNVSTSLKELRALGVVRAAAGQAPGDRRERFEALSDPWEAAANIAAARRAREFDPAVAALNEAAAAADGDAAARLEAYASLAGAAGSWADQMTSLPRSALKGVLKTGAAVAEALPGKKKKKKK